MQASDKDRASLRTLVNLLRKTTCLRLDGVSSETGLIMQIIGQDPGKFCGITSLNITYDENYHDYFMSIPAEFIAQLSSLSFESKSSTVEPELFMQATSSLLEKSQNLRKLRLCPYQKSTEWISILA